jgi:AraC-like DNA-binding protein
MEDFKMPTKWLSASLLSGIDKILLEQFSLSISQIENEIAFNFNSLKNSDDKISLTTAVKVLDDCAKYTGCQYFGALLANEQNNENLSLMHSLAESCHTFEEAFTEVFEQNVKQESGFEWQSSKDESNAYTIIDITDKSGIDTTQTAQFGIIRLFKFFKKITRNEWQPTQIHFTFPAPDSIEYLQKILGVDLYFNMEFNGFIFPVKQLSLEMNAQNMKFNAAFKDFLTLTGQFSSTNKLTQIKRSIRSLLILNQRCTLTDIAVSQHQTTRAIQYYLKKHQLTYQNLLDGVRYNIARDLLIETENSIYKISSLIGFADSTVFTRSFKKHVGLSPTKYRQEYKDLKLENNYML